VIALRLRDQTSGESSGAKRKEKREKRKGKGKAEAIRRPGAASTAVDRWQHADYRAAPQHQDDSGERAAQSDMADGDEKPLAVRSWRTVSEPIDEETSRSSPRFVMGVDRRAA